MIYKHRKFGQFSAKSTVAVIQSLTRELLPHIGKAQQDRMFRIIEQVDNSIPTVGSYQSLCGIYDEAEAVRRTGGV